MDDRIPALMKRVVEWLVNGNFEAAEAYSNGIRLSAGLIREAICGYGKKLVMPPESAFSNLDVIEVVGTISPTWSIRFDLWTDKEGISDLTLECTMIDRGGKALALEIDNLHVL